MSKPTVLIIGGSSGVGGVLAEHYLKSGETVIAHGHTHLTDLERMKTRFPQQLICLGADLEKESDVQLLMDKVLASGSDIRRVIFCAAPVPLRQRLTEVSWPEFQRSIDVQVKSTFLILQRLMSKLPSQNWMRILYVDSIYTLETPPAFIYPYVAAKFMLNGLMMSLSEEFQRKNVFINGIAPAMMETRFIKDVPDLVKEAAREAHPEKRLIRPEELLPTMLSLLDEKSTVTGTVVPYTGR